MHRKHLVTDNLNLQKYLDQKASNISTSLIRRAHGTKMGFQEQHVIQSISHRAIFTISIINACHLSSRVSNLHKNVTISRYPSSTKRGFFIGRRSPLLCSCAGLKAPLDRSTTLHGRSPQRLKSLACSGLLIFEMRQDASRCPDLRRHHFDASKTASVSHKDGESHASPISRRELELQSCLCLAPPPIYQDTILSRGHLGLSYRSLLPCARSAPKYIVEHYIPLATKVLVSYPRSPRPTSWYMLTSTAFP